MRMVVAVGGLVLCLLCPLLGSSCDELLMAWFSSCMAWTLGDNVDKYRKNVWKVVWSHRPTTMSMWRAAAARLLLTRRWPSPSPPSAATATAALFLHARPFSPPPPRPALPLQIDANLAVTVVCCWSRLMRARCQRRRRSAERNMARPWLRRATHRDNARFGRKPYTPSKEQICPPSHNKIGKEAF